MYLIVLEAEAMSKNEYLFNIERHWRVFGGVLAATGALALTGCGSNEGESKTTVASIKAQSNVPSSVPSKEVPVLVFDDLGGGSSIIQVYPGAKDVAADKKTNGTFNVGDSVPAECKTEGRTVHSDMSTGEVDRTSSDWIRIEGAPGETQYATAVYVESPQTLLRQLPEC